MKISYTLFLSDQTLDRMFYEARQRLRWWIMGIGIHGISGELFDGLSTERICELYNVELTYFRPWTT